MKNKFSTFALAWLATLLALVYTTGGALAAPAASAYTDSAASALKWIKTQQAADGSFNGFGAGSSVDAVLAIIASGGNPTTYGAGDASALTFLQTNAGAIGKTAGGAGKLLVAVSALGQNGKSFGGVDLVSAINATYGISATSQFGTGPLDDAFAILGLHSAGATVPAEAVTALEDSQLDDGGWSFSGDKTAGADDTNTTAVVVQALLAEGAIGGSLDKAAAYLAGQQNTDGGWPYQKGGAYGSDSDVNSTAYVVQALLALKNTTLAEAGQKFMVSLQKPNGAFQYQQAVTDDNAGATYQAITALLGATFLAPGTYPTPATPITDNESPEATPTAIPAPTGMPITGSGTDWLPVAALIFSALVLSTAGFAVRKSSAR